MFVYSKPLRFVLILGSLDGRGTYSVKKGTKWDGKNHWFPKGGEKIMKKKENEGKIEEKEGNENHASNSVFGVFI